LHIVLFFIFIYHCSVTCVSVPRQFLCFLSSLPVHENFKTASLSQFTLHINGASHGINQVFGNSHSKIKSLFYNPSSDFHPISRLSYYSQFSRTSFSLFISNGFARCPFMPVFFASCTSSAKALAVMATIGSFPCSPGRLLIAAVAS